MPSDLSSLSIRAIRDHIGASGEPISPRLLAALKRDPRRAVQVLHGRLNRRQDTALRERLRIDRMLELERQLQRSGLQNVAGIDEAGVGPLAGPVVAAAVVFPPDFRLDGVDDSKRLAPTRRAALAKAIHAGASGVGIGVVEVEEIDRFNIYQATLRAMVRAVQALPMNAQYVLVDARTLPGIMVPQRAIVHGDAQVFCIAAASIIAKTHRDRLMQALDARYPGYGLARHQGYGTAQHLRALRHLGPCPAHRRSFGPVRGCFLAET